MSSSLPLPKAPDLRSICDRIATKILDSFNGDKKGKAFPLGIALFLGFDQVRPNPVVDSAFAMNACTAVEPNEAHSFANQIEIAIEECDRRPVSDFFLRPADAPFPCRDMVIVIYLDTPARRDLCKAVREDCADRNDVCWECRVDVRLQLLWYGHIVSMLGTSKKGAGSKLLAEARLSWRIDYLRLDNK